MGIQIAGIIENGVPFLAVGFGQPLALFHLVGKALGQLVTEECAHFLTEGLFFGV